MPRLARGDVAKLDELAATLGLVPRVGRRFLVRADGP